MIILALILAAIYSLALVFITVYAVLEFHLLYCYLRSRRRINALRPGPVAEWPRVTVQLPVFNELYVVERLIDDVCQLEYPLDKLEIQVLDDSTDETRDLVARKCVHYSNLGIPIKHIHRTQRNGYKAGALKEGLAVARGEFITIFDADFLPQPDFLKRCIPYFEDPAIGVVQTRWEHINETYSLLTRLQAFQLNVHFTIEQSGRQAGGYFLQFNGTAGTWRRQAIEEAGGWHTDTLTEDLDLSFRAQLKGWKIHYLQDIGSPSELPAEMNGLKSQQARWMKGGAEVARKLIPVIWSSTLSVGAKVHAIILLLGSSIFLFVLALAVTSLPLAFLLGQLGMPPKLFAFGLLGTISIIAIHFIVHVWVLRQKRNLGLALIQFLGLFPLFLSFSMGLSLHNSIAVLQGWRGKKSAFERTPKFNIKSIRDRLSHHKYLSHRLSWVTLAEGMLAAYFIFGVCYGIISDQTSFLVFHLALSIGFSGIFAYTLIHMRLKD